MLIIAPIFSGRTVPVRIRLLLALMITAIIVPVLPSAPDIDPFSPASALITAQQFILGVAIGFSVQLIFAALVLAGQTIAMGMGLGFASMVDPQNGVQVPVIGQYYVVMATLLFLGLNGHLALVQLLFNSFEFIPVGTDSLDRGDLKSMAYWGSRLFTNAIQVSIPAVIAILLVNISFGVVARAAPQLNIFGVGFPVIMVLGFTVLTFSISGLLPQFTLMVDESFSAIMQLAERQP